MGATDVRVGFKPLYSQVRDEIIRRLADRRWLPGQALPSEPQLAQELGVSQGTVRKALDALTSENILVRRQGKGTFVAEFGENRVLFQFFRLFPEKGECRFPGSRFLRRSSGVANGDEREFLKLAKGSQVFRVERVRLNDTKPILREKITVSAEQMPGLLDVREMPNNVYRLYSEAWAITVARASERLRACPATSDDVTHLGCALGAPILQIQRTAFDLVDRPVEFRVSHCLTDDVFYSSELR
jgi:GntR family transcriptional regulator